MSNEFFYIEKGKKQDEKLHGPILNNEKADRETRAIGMKVAKEILGYDDETLLEVYGV